MNNNEFRKISKSKLNKWLEDWTLIYYNKISWEVVETYKSDYYSRSERFQKFTIDWNMLEQLSHDYLWKYMILAWTGRDFKDNRLERYYLEKLFEKKSPQAMRKFMSSCVKANYFKKIKWHYYFNPYIVNNFWKIKVWSEQDKLFNEFQP